MKALIFLSIISTCLANYSFVTEYAPRIWMDQLEQYYPCSVEFYQNYTHVEVINGSNWLLSNEKVPDPSAVLQYFYGQNPANITVPVYTIILPDPMEPDPVKALQQPLNHSIIATYFTLYPYNRGKEVLDTIWDNHVGDIEHAHIYFTNGKPTLVIASYHQWNTTKKWGDPDIEIVNGTHPVLYSARGSHGLWFSAGTHIYIPIINLADYTSQGVPWDTWNNIFLVFPWDWNSTYNPTWKVNSYWNNLLRWGDPHTEFEVDNCYDIFNNTVCRFDDGPGGFLGKSCISSIIQSLEKKGVVCEKGCLWNAGIFGNDLFNKRKVVTKKVKKQRKVATKKVKKQRKVATKKVKIDF